MSTRRIKAIVLQELYITKRSFEVTIDMFFFAGISLVIFGLMAIFLSGENEKAAQYLLIGMLFWEVIRVTQYSISLVTQWNTWSKNLSNMFISPLSIKEYFGAQMISGILKVLFTFVPLSLISIFLFNFNIYEIGILNIIFYIINLVIFAWSIGIMIIGAIFRFGTRIMVLSWSLIFIFQPLCAVFFPVSVLPDFLQKVAFILPPSHVFEAARANLSNPATNWSAIGIAFFENIIYFLISAWVFTLFFNKSKETGQLARNEN